MQDKTINKIVLNIRDNKPVIDFYKDKEVCTIEVPTLARKRGFETIKTRDEFKKLLTYWVNKIQVTYNKINFRRMRQKWASCSTKKNLVFNSLLFGMPKIFVQYIIVHELLHFKIPSHGKLFKIMLKKYLPDWQKEIGTMLIEIESREWRLPPI